MILTELTILYDRLAADPDHADDIAHPGWSLDKVAWALVIDEGGEVLQLVPLVVDGGQKYQLLRVPEHVGRSGKYPTPYFLCDKASYLLGLDEKNGEGNRERSRALHERVLEGCDDVGARAVLAFFSRPNPAADLSEAEREALQSGGMVVLCLQRPSRRVCERSAIRQAWERYRQQEVDEGQVSGWCSVTGRKGPLARLFPQVTGIPGAQSSGASLVSFNFDASESYGKSQAYNASLSPDVAFKAGSALKYLLGNRERRTRVGDIIVTFWTDAPAPIEDSFLAQILGATRSAEDKDTRDALDLALSEMRRGIPLTTLDPKVGYCILGVAPNAARLAVKFFERGTFGQLAERYGQYLRDIEMTRVKSVSMRQLLLQTAPLGKDDNIPKTLFTRCFSAMLDGDEFPRALDQLVVARMRADHATRNSWDLGQRAAILKACLVRRHRKRGVVLGETEEIGMDVNKGCTNEAYALGRLFAVMERAQRADLGDTNTTIRDCYLGAASATPARVFPPLMRNYEAHHGALRKKKPGLAYLLDREFGEIMASLGTGESPNGLFPKVLDQDDQNAFFIGFYQELWVPLKAAGSSGDNSTDESVSETDATKED